MLAVIFEVWPHPEQREAYLDWAAQLKAELLTMDGFISIERFQSLTDPDKLLSLSFWRDEASLAQWRNREAHRAAQAAGRSRIFRDYRLRIAAVMRDYGLEHREQAPADSRRLHG
jgi:heme-degrading monooxygenase HmoA